MIRICSGPYLESQSQPLSHTFDFPLSDFQKYAIEGLSTGHHVLVTAHTGSGKTLPAEFAIRHFVSTLGKKVIYTSPIKALSNQKFYEFSRKFPDISIGLFTGDIKVNPMAQVLIMTTEILMNHLYSLNTTSNDETTGGENKCIGQNTEINGALNFNIDIENELACVVFDEVHYINDKDRGNVWEQTILMLPPHVQMLMLSATIDDAEGFAKWCASRDTISHTLSTGALPPMGTTDWVCNRGVTKSLENNPGDVCGISFGSGHKEVWLTGTTSRVVPLTHYLYMTTTEAIFKYVKDKTAQSEIRAKTNNLIPIRMPNGEFKETAIHTVKTVKSLFDKHRIFIKRKHVLNQLTLHLKEREMLPAIAFVFSRKNVEICAKEITTNLLPFDSKVPYTIRHECEQILRKFPNHHEYTGLPEYEELVALLERGIGIHHSGMIPVFKEIVELMISQKKIMLLFATESFAIGLDCPIKTAIFTSLTKYDGQGPRFLMSHEYTQMAGRAGRRGIDTIGHVVHCSNLFNCPSTTEYKEILCGKPQKLTSKFHVNYNVVMNIIRQNSIATLSKITDYVKKSMSYTQFMRRVSNQESAFKSAQEAVKKQEEIIEKNGRTKSEACERWIVLNQILPTLQNKKRKEAERELAAIESENRYLTEDVGRIRELQRLRRIANEEDGYLKHLNEYHIGQVENVICVLLESRFIEVSQDCSSSSSIPTVSEIQNEFNYSLTRLGEMSQITEIHGLVIAQILTATQMFRQYQTEDIIRIFSLFTDIKVSDEIRVNRTEDNTIMNVAKLLDSEFQYFEEREKFLEIDTGIDYTQPLVYDLIDVVDEWISAQDEPTCKACIQRATQEKGISVGDFTKAMLKICTVAKEVGAICEKLGEIELLNKLSRVDGVILKYMITSQSLYV
jgi:superfamily II RNA helicase